MSGRPWRLIVHGAAAGSANMAIDEALLERYEGSEQPPAPTLRLYGWSPAAVSLGRPQSAQTGHDPAFLRDEAIDLVRRPTGGTAVLHEHERTYAVVGRLRREPFPSGVLDTHRRISMALVAALARLGVRATTADPFASPATRRRPVACFARAGAHEITVGGRKLLGSAQLRRRRAFLQHGSLLLRADPARLARALGLSSIEASFTDLGTVVGRVVSDDEIDAALVSGFEAVFGATFRPSRLDEAEAARAAQLRCWKYDSACWTLDGRVGERERRWCPQPLP